MKHIFVSVVRSNNDPFAGIKNALAADAGNRICELRFDEDGFDLIDRVEYSERRFFRFFYYPKIFSGLLARLEDALDQVGDEQAIIYFSDEGVWAALWASYRSRNGQRQFKAVNVQHGIAPLRPARFQPIRKTINWLSTLVSGYPCIGYGSLGGAGAHAFDLYLTYDERAAHFANEQTGRKAIAAPHLIKHDVITAFSAISESESDRVQFLFAMNINMRGSPVKCDVGQTFDALLELATLLNEMNARLILRLHPGMDRDREMARFALHPISRVAEIDKHISPHVSMANARVVMSFVSTVLWEAGLLGLLPVQIICACCDYVDLSFEREEINLAHNLRANLTDLLDRARRSQTKDWQEVERMEWRTVCTELAPALAVSAS
jgi:hypothetical protein